MAAGPEAPSSFSLEEGGNQMATSSWVPEAQPCPLNFQSSPNSETPHMYQELERVWTWLSCRFKYCLCHTPCYDLGQDFPPSKSPRTSFSRACHETMTMGGLLAMETTASIFHFSPLSHLPVVHILVHSPSVAMRKVKPPHGKTTETTEVPSTNRQLRD